MYIGELVPHTKYLVLNLCSSLNIVPYTAPIAQKYTE